MVLLEGGVDVEVDVDFADMTSIFDEEVPKYTCGEFGFTVTPGRGEIGGQWIFMVSAFSLLEVERELVSLGAWKLRSIVTGMSLSVFRQE